MKKMSTFRDEIASILKEVGIDIETADYMEMPTDKDAYDVSRVIGNVNLMSGRFRIKSEVDEMVDKFISMQLP